MIPRGPMFDSWHRHYNEFLFSFSLVFFALVRGSFVSDLPSDSLYENIYIPPIRCWSLILEGSRIPPTLRIVQLYPTPNSSRRKETTHPILVEKKELEQNS
jgi:hypothetical protein